MEEFFYGKEDIDIIEKMIASETDDWLGKFSRGELQGNLMLPYVTLYYMCQDQVRMIKEYTEYIKDIEITCKKTNLH